MSQAGLAASIGARPRSGLAYGALALPLAFLALPLYVALPLHYAQWHGVPLAWLGSLLLATRLLDAGLDPFIGQGIDHLLAGSRRRLTLVAAGAALLVGGGFVALFFAPFPPGRSSPGLLVWLVLHLLLVYLGYSTLAVLHQAWGTRLGGDAPQRARIAAWREGCGLAGILLASLLASAGQRATSSVVLGLTLALGLALLLRLPSGAKAPASAFAPAPAWHRPWRAPGFRGLLGVYMLNGIGNAVAATLVGFFVQDRLQLPESLPLFLGCYFAAGVLSLPLWLRLVARLGLATCWLAGMLLSVAAFAGALALGPGDGAGFAAVCLASGLALGADLAVPAAMLTGVVQQARRPQEAGVYAGWWTAAGKLNLGLAAGLALPLLGWAGYAPGRRDPLALQALSLAYVLLPCLLKLLAVAGLLHWRRRSLLEIPT